ncbi:MAG TPA: bifunctional hydroxymethylpyrimidine kinase/phosphomethylpyrimidine kinase [Pyrinomonadaceae bacterium]|nr:bifunctional hydroxymethylpyrimidine kinase/phosphomethylpyrimidine kinase [Pyrinomonadaceae bacterium]
MKQKICLTIAGLDPSGGAGVIADIKTFAAFRCYAAAAIVSVTFQNTQGVFGAENLSAETVRNQVLPILDDFKVDALKTGMLPTREIIEEVARIVAENNLQNFVVDPVVRSTSGFDLIDDKALRVLIEKLFPLSVVITPNIPEAERITNIKIKTVENVRKAAKMMQKFGAKNVLIKGGHLPFGDLEYDSGDAESNTKVHNGRKAIDFLFMGNEELRFEADFIETTATHGTGCTFAAAIVACLANGKNLPEAVEAAKRFVTEAILTAPNLGRGHSPINHLIREF